MKWHADFRLDGHCFESRAGLLNYVRKNYPEHANFLENWFDKGEEIVLQTSGSTGAPHPYHFSKGQLIKSAERTIRSFGLYEKTRALLNLSSQFVAGKLMWVRALTGGWHLEVVAPNEKIPGKLYDFGAMVPLQIRRQPELAGRFKVLLLGGAPLSKTMEKLLRTTPARVFATYGMTETLTHIALRPVSYLAAEWLRDYPGGRFDLYMPLEGVEIETDGSGRITIRDNLLDITVTTSDLGEVYEGGLFRWLGRADHTVNSGGIKIIPEEVERKLEKYVPVPFFVAGIRDEEWGEKLILVMETEDAQALNVSFKDIPELRFYEKPKEVFFTDAFERTVSGKIKRSETLRKLGLM